ncbi:MAG: Ig-like domain-containing protein, partial [Solirubrobacterales bacterium]
MNWAGRRKSRARLRRVAAFALLLTAVSAAPVLADPESNAAVDPTGAATNAGGAEPPSSPEGIGQALVQGERENAAEKQARAEELASPQAQREREVSREAYADFSNAEAQALLAETFAEELEELDSDPARAITDLDVEKTFGTYAARVSDEEGERELVESPIPLRTAENGETETVDLSLERSGGGFVPRVPLSGVRLPDSASGSIQLQSGIAVTDLPGDGDPSAHRFGDKDLFFPESGIETDTLVSPLTGGVEIFQQLRSPESPEQFRYQLSLPAGTKLRADGQGGAEVVDSAGKSLAIVPAPWAVDAQGDEIPVTMAVEDSALVLAVQHRSLDVAYPLLVDPEIIEHWESWNFGFNTHALGYWSWHETGPYEHSTGCIVTCWGPGLYARSRGNNVLYGANTKGQFTYEPPGSTSYIRQVIFGPNNGDVNNCFTNQPHGYVGIFNPFAGAFASLGIYSPLSSTGSTFNTGSVGGPGSRQAVVGIGTGNVSSKLTCGHDFYVGGATIFLDDPEAPTLGTPTGPGRPVSHDPAPITITASDPGLGVSLVKSEAMGSDGEIRTWFTFRGCTGLTESPCAPAAWSGVPVIYDPSVLPPGNNTLTIRAQDAVGHQSAPQTVTVTVDRTPPDTAIDSGPANNGAIAGTTTSFTYHATEPNSSFECRLDSGTFASCSISGFTTPSLAAGSHTFAVRAVDPAGNTDLSAASRTFFVGPPDTVIDTGPSGPTNNTTPTFTYHATQPEATFFCRVDGGAFASCSSGGFSTPPLADGPHTVSVRAIGSAGAPDSSPATRSFTVDGTPPTLSLGTGPAGPTNSAKPTFAFVAEPGATLRCSIDTGAAGFATCSNAASHTPASPLSDQTYTFRVRAIDGLGNQATATRGFTVDTTPPDTSIDAAPTGLTGDPVPTFSYSSSESNAGFECRFDAAGFAPCGEESFEPADPLADGQHTFSVRAVDLAGNADPTPSSESFSVKATAPALKLESGPTGPTSDPTPTFGFSAAAEATLSCSTEAAAVELEETSFEVCSGPESDTASPPLEDGPYTFRARAADSAENLTTVARRFTVDTEAPDTAVESGPAATTDDSRPTFGFASSEQRSGFECRFDASPFAPCSGPGPTQTPSAALSDGDHTLQVRAVDRAGNVDVTAATRSFAVITTAPQTRLLSAPTGPIAVASQTFKYEADQSASFECRLDEAAFAPCPASGLSTTGLSEGEHSFEVRALNAATTLDPTPAARHFVVDTSPPAAPVANGELRAPGTPGVSLHVELRDGNASSPSSLRAGMETIRVFVDGQLIYSDEMPCIGRFGTCPDTISRELELPYQAVLGAHVFRVEGTDALGHTSSKAEWNEFTPDEGTILRLSSKAGECTKGASTAHVHVDKGAAVLRGSDGSDILIGRAGIETIRGMGGCDVIIGGPESEKIEGGPDEDIIRAGRNNDEIIGNGGKDVLFGGIGDDDLFGGPGADRLDGGPGADKEVGEEDDDALRGGQGQDQLSGNSGEDTLSYADAVPPGYSANETGVTNVLNFPDGVAGEHGVYIDLRGGRGTGDNAGEGAGGGLDYLYIPDGTAKPGNAGVRVPGSFERIVGSPFADVIRGSGGKETIEAGPGADVVFGGGGADAIKGGAHGDFLEASGDASLDGGDSEQDSCAGSVNVTSCGAGRAIGRRDRGKVAIGIQRPGAPGEDADVFVSGSSDGDVVAANYDPNANTVQLTGPVNVEAVSGCTHVEGSTVTNCPMERNKDLGALVLFGGAGNDRLSVGAIADPRPA